MTFNLRVDAEVDGINRFPRRKGRILEVIEKHKPHVIGFQEANDAMREWLSEALSGIGYTVVGCGRNTDFRGESVPVAFLSDAFDLEMTDTKWLSPTPDVPGSTFGGDQSHCPRILTSAALKPREGREFLFLNTHLDHKGENARVLGSKFVTSYLSDKRLPFIVTGDMNALPDSPAINIFLSSAPNGKKCIDATSGVGGTFHAFGRKSGDEKTKIDYVFTDMVCDASESFAVSEPPVDGIYVSDHDPVMAYIALE